MEITNIHITPAPPTELSSVLARATVIFDGVLEVNGFSLRRSTKTGGLFVGFPRRFKPAGVNDAQREVSIVRARDSGFYHRLLTEMTEAYNKKVRAAPIGVRAGAGNGVDADVDTYQ